MTVRRLDARPMGAGPALAGVLAYASGSPAVGHPRPPGIYVLRFCTVNAPLSSVALLDFAAGRRLPSGFGVEVEEAIAQVHSPSGVTTEYKGESVTTDAPGLYHAEVTMLAEGAWQWEGQGWAGATLVTSTGIIPWQIGPAIKT